MGFPKGFVWGTEMSAYQAEGAAFEDGKGPSVWDLFSRRPGSIWNNQTADTACDHYYRYREDVGLMRELGIQVYRPSVSWPRVLPEGTGQVNEKGLAFYDRLVDELLNAGITPYIALFHWDFPYELFCRGGWLNRDVAGWFADYTRVVVDRLSDRVSCWITMVEPSNYITQGHHRGVFAPGLRLSAPETMRAWHHNMLAHGRAVQVIRARAKTPPLIGYEPGVDVKTPASDSPADITAARQAMFQGPEGDALWTDPVCLGKYPDGVLDAGRGVVPAFVRDGDMDAMCQPLDFLAVNIYMGFPVRMGPNGSPEAVPLPPNTPLTLPLWPVTPEAMYWGLRFYWERYRLPLLVSENGMSNVDWVASDGRVHDPQRIDFLHRYLVELERAGQDGVELLGYLVWSFLDNFEWADGFKQRYGLVHVDHTTQRRTIKDSGHWFSRVIQTHGASLHEK